MSVRLLCSSNIKPIANWFLLYTIELKRILKASSDHKTILLLLAQLVVNQFRWNLAICLLFAFQFPVLFKNKKNNSNASTKQFRKSQKSRYRETSNLAAKKSLFHIFEFDHLI